MSRAAFEPAVSLVHLPGLLGRGITRRLPRGNRFKNITGRTYKGCTVLGFAGYKGAFAAWLCRCKCGRQFVREGAYLKKTDRHGCGCSKTPKSPIPNHIRTAWRSMNARCYDRRHRDYPAYGKRGIRVCRRLRRSVENFAVDLGPRPSPKHVLARRDKSGNFTPKNCFWGTFRDRQRTDVRLIAHDRRSQCLAAWAEELGITREAMRYRINECLKRGINPSLAITTPTWQRLPKR